MDPTDVQKHLMDVLTTIQTISQEACPTLDPTVRPAEDLPKFNSKVWPVAAGMLGAALSKEIPPDVNIFVDDTTKQALTIAQTVQLVCTLVKQLDTQAAAAAA
ncbi:hypothetical protein [Sinorhizobium meliloti]|uniref:hypothetical protein n=1 Tax=Rhizobium meliloti TaxID=382 RepID=UPI000FD76F2B|nr:hypothetical protein [Sinorhizobium meliloti]RVG22681.1 hypothetical protein CN233_30885 [Sinorhizobium meliloti]RVK90294.1 hypothetical protein CN152_29620 [Sinorhizobium meliloti]RVN37348.1 hypothetical protein CN113_31310 [Sinorhizobium meliloti]RVO49539.1 hypothetical protein CN092_28580 [Sinorhizobium meliloti]